MSSLSASPSRAHPRGHEGGPQPWALPDRALTDGASGCRLSSKPLLASEAYELGAGVRKRHKGPEEEHDALVGTGKVRGRSQPWDEHGAPSDFLSQVRNPPPTAGSPVLQRNWTDGCLRVSSLPPCPEEMTARRLTTAAQPQAELSLKLAVGIFNPIAQLHC